MTLTELQASARRKISFNLTSAGYSDANLNASLNEWYRTVFGWALLASGIWELSGDVYTTNLVADQAAYALPSNLIYISRVEIFYAGASGYVKSTRLDDKETDNSLQNDVLVGQSEARPVHRFLGNNVILRPIPDENKTSGLAIILAEDVTSLSTGSDVPDLNPLIHRAVALGGALDYAVTQEMYRKSRELRGELMGFPGGSTENTLKRQIEQLAEIRDRSVKANLRARPRSYR